MKAVNIFPLPKKKFFDNFEYKDKIFQYFSEKYANYFRLKYRMNNLVFIKSSIIFDKYREILYNWFFKFMLQTEFWGK